MITCITFIPLVAALLILLTPSGNCRAMRVLAFSGSMLSLVGVLVLLLRFDASGGLQFVEKISWIAALGVYALRRGATTSGRLQHGIGLALFPFLGLILALSVGNPQLDHASHAGGLLSGLILGGFLPTRTLRHRRHEHPTRPSPHPRSWTLAAAACGVLTLFTAQALAGGRSTPTTVQVVEQVAVDIPPTYRPALDDLGRVVYRGHSNLVRLTVDTVPRYRDAPVDAPRAWAVRERLAPLVEASILTTRTSPAAAPTLEEPCESHAFTRGSNPVNLEVCAVSVATQKVVVTLETPAEWTERYRPMLLRVLGSIRPAPSANAE